MREMQLDQEQLAKPFRKRFRGVRGGNGLVLVFVFVTALTPGSLPRESHRAAW